MIGLYALLGAPPVEWPVGVAPQIVACGPVWAAVEEIEAAPALTVTGLRRHDAVVRSLTAAVDAVAPARFGVVASDWDALNALVATRQTEVSALLDLVAGRAQMTLRIFDASAPDAPVTTSPSEGEGSGPGTSYLLQRVGSATTREAPIRQIREALGAIVVAEQVETRIGHRLVASVYHLVARGDTDRYRAALVDGGVSEKVIVSGPAPCYAFAGSLKL